MRRTPSPREPRSPVHPVMAGLHPSGTTKWPPWPKRISGFHYPVHPLIFQPLPPGLTITGKEHHQSRGHGGAEPSMTADCWDHPTQQRVARGVSAFCQAVGNLGTSVRRHKGYKAVRLTTWVLRSKGKNVADLTIIEYTEYLRQLLMSHNFLDNGGIIGCPWISPDLLIARSIFGECVKCRVGKMTNPSALTSQSPGASSPGELLHSLEIQVR